MPKKTDIDALYEKALALEAYAQDLVDAAERSRIALAMAIRSQGHPDHRADVKEALATLPAVDAAVAEALARWAFLVAAKKK